MRGLHVAHIPGHHEIGTEGVTQRRDRTIRARTVTYRYASVRVRRIDKPDVIRMLGEIINREYAAGSVAGEECGSCGCHFRVLLVMDWGGRPAPSLKCLRADDAGFVVVTRFADPNHRVFLN